MATAPSGAPVSGAVVAIEALGIATQTDRRGSFTLTQIPRGHWVLTVRLIGFRPREVMVNLSEIGEAPSLSIELEPQPVPLAAIEALRNRSEIGRNADRLPGSVQVIERSERENHTLLYDDVNQVLRTVPGVNIQEEDAYGLRPNIGLRGTGTERSSKVTIMEDGVLIQPAPYAAPSAYYFPLLSRMAAVEVRKGSSQIHYGPRTIGGAINLVSTPIPDGLMMAADIAGGENTTAKATARVGDAGRNFGWLIEGTSIRTDGFKRIDGDLNETGFDIQDVVARLRLNMDRDASVYQELQFKIGFYDERSNETYLGLTDADFSVNPNRRYPASAEDLMNAEQRQLQARYFIQPSDRIDFSATAYRNDFRRNWYKLQSVFGQGISSVLDDPAGNAAALSVLRGADSAGDALRVRANNRQYFGEGVQTVLGLSLDHGPVTHRIELGGRLHRDEEDRFQHEDA
ncbi:MAG: TonB-dependent receptor plug domain-containing protein, partial [Gemmatimonadales bacterium]